MGELVLQAKISHSVEPGSRRWFTAKRIQSMPVQCTALESGDHQKQRKKSQVDRSFSRQASCQKIEYRLGSIGKEAQEIVSLWCWLTTESSDLSRTREPRPESRTGNP